MSHHTDSSKPFNCNKIFIDGSVQDVQKIMRVIDKLKEYCGNIVIGTQLNYIEKIDLIKQSDEVLFFISKKTFSSNEHEGLYDDYQCCLDFNKRVHCVCIDNIDGINIHSLSSKMYAFWSKIRRIQGININTFSDDSKNAKLIVDSIQTPVPRRIRRNIKEYVFSVLIILILLLIYFLTKGRLFVLLF